MSKHTPTPWHVDHAPWMGLKFGVLYQGSVIAECREITPDADKANAQHIVKCVNNYDRLIGALDAIVHSDSPDNELIMIRKAKKLLDELETLG